MCENAYLSIKNQKASRALKQALDPGRRMLASLTQLRFAMSATFGLRSWAPPLDKILDPHLDIQENFNQFREYNARLYSVSFILFPSSFKNNQPSVYEAIIP